MSREILNFFPLTVVKSKIELSDDEKNQMVKEILVMEKNSKNLNNKSDQRSWTGDTQGFEFIHKNLKFEKFFKEVKKKVLDYLEILEIDNSQLDIFIQRSWATISRDIEHISLHKHLQSHLSFAYYLKKDASDANLVFVDENKSNEFLPALFISPGVHRKQIIKKRNFYNSPMVVCEAKEDEIIIFPSKTPHQTQKNVKNKERISISSDIFITSKDSSNMEHLVTPFLEWKKL